MQAPYFDDASGSVRFWVDVDGIPVAASVRRETLHYHYCPHARDDDALQTHARHAPEMDAAVRRRIAQGAREPVMLREFDLRPPAETPAVE